MPQGNDKVRSCDCKICQDHRRLSRIRAKLSARDAKWLDSYITEKDTAELDCNVYSAILDGSWPSAEEQLRNALRNIEENKRSLANVQKRVDQIRKEPKQ